MNEEWSCFQVKVTRPLLNPFVPNAPFLYLLKTLENRKVFWCFRGVEKGCIGNEWVNCNRFTRDVLVDVYNLLTHIVNCPLFLEWRNLSSCKAINEIVSSAVICAIYCMFSASSAVICVIYCMFGFLSSTHFGKVSIYGFIMVIAIK